MNARDIYFTSSLPVPVLVTGALALSLLLVVGCCTLINRVTRRPVVNGWLWGGALVVYLVMYQLISAYRLGPVDGPATGSDFGSDDLGVAIGVLSLIAVAAWRALAWRRSVIRSQVKS